jgi:anaerobic magnesium-protoporphyrin IX monomethyl ester cyclase
MRAIFVDLSCNFYDKHWVYSLAPVLKQRGVEVDYVNVRSARAVGVVKNFKPDVVLYSAFSNELSKVIAFDRELKKVVPCRSLMGGTGPTFDWKCHKGTSIDAICVGEGETALAEYLDSGLAGGRNIILNGQDKPSGLVAFPPLDSLPFPDRDIVYRADSILAATTSKQFMSGRGCPYECTYCFNHAFNNMFKECGTVVRKKSVDYLLEEIRHIQKKFPLGLIVFQDDTFILDHRWLFEFCERLPAEIGLPFSCNIRANLVNEQVAEALRDGGCVSASWSIETGTDKLRNEVLLRHMSREAILRAGELLHKHGIRQRLANIIGIPGETIEDLHETARLNIQVRPMLSTANIFVPYPGLRLTQYALEGGYLSQGNAEDLPKDFSTRSVLNFSKAHNRYLQKTFCLFPFFVKFPPLFQNGILRRALYAIPYVLLRVAYEAFFLVNGMKFFCVGGSWKVKLRMLGRYIKNIL